MEAERRDRSLVLIKRQPFDSPRPRRYDVGTRSHVSKLTTNQLHRLYDAGMGLANDRVSLMIGHRTLSLARTLLGAWRLTDWFGR